jgi:antitoxin (DNA-binding transcriptional repressor) of toxin-antitoxin stability system
MTVGVREAPTHFGNVSYRIESGVERGLLQAEIDPPTRHLPDRIVLHLRHPRRSALQNVKVNGQPWTDFDPAQEIVRLQPLNAKLHVEARY